MLFKLVLGKSIMTVLSTCVPQTCLDNSVEDLFYENLQLTLIKISASEILFVCRDFSGHIGKNKEGCELPNGGRELGRRNLEGERIVEVAVAHNLVVSNSLFAKKESHLVKC